MENTTESVNNTMIENTPQMCFWGFVVRNPSTSYVINSVISCVLNGVSTIVGMFLNLLIVISLWRSRQLQHKVTYFLIMVLSLLYLGVAVIISPLAIANLATEMSGNPKCMNKEAFLVLSLWIGGMSIVTAFVLNAERYMSIVHPIHHRNSVSKRRCVFLIVVLSIIFLSISLNHWSKSYSLVAAYMLIDTLGVVLMYVAIFRSARKVLKTRPCRDLTLTSSNDEITKKDKSYQRDLKLAKMCFLIVLSSLICYLPQIIVLIMWQIQSIALNVKLNATNWSTSIFILNPIISGLVLLWTNTRLRSKCVKTIQLVTQSREFSE